MKKVICMLLCGVFLLTGCSSRSYELEGSAVIKALAFDRVKDGYEITAYIAGAENEDIITLSAESAAEGLYELNTETERKIFLGKNQVILISAEIRNIEEILMTLYSSQEARMSAKLLIVQGTAKEVLSYRGLYQEAATDIEKTMENASENSNYPLVTLFGGVNSMASVQGCCVLPMAKMEEDNLVLERCAVYEKFRKIQTLDGQQMLGCALLREDESAFFSVGQNGYALREVSVKNTPEGGENRIRLKCTYRLLTGNRKERADRERVEAELRQAMEAAYLLAQKLNMNFLELYPCDVSLPARITVTAEPSANDYPQEGILAQ